MEELLPYYERELAFLRRYSNDFADRYPKIAARLAMSGEHCEDPHVERMIESFALLGARINKKLDDDYPEFTEALLEVLYPHYLRPFPSCSIAQLGTSSAFSHMTEPATIERGTELKSRPIRGVQCRFRTAYDVTLAPIRISEARYTSVAMAPSATVLPANASAMVSITFESTAPQLDLGALKLSTLRAHLHGEQSFIAGLTDCLFVNAMATYVEADRRGVWTALRASPLAQAGFDEEDSLIDYPAKSHPAYRLLTEYFAFPDKFNFVDFDLAAMTRASGRCQRLTLHVVLKDVRNDSHVARLLVHCLDEMASFGFEVLVIAAGHYPLLSVARAACQFFYADRGQIAWAFTGYELVRDRFPKAGDHAGPWETSLMLALRPDLVDMDKAEGPSAIPDLYDRVKKESSVEYGQKALALLTERVSEVNQRCLAALKNPDPSLFEITYLAHCRGAKNIATRSTD